MAYDREREAAIGAVLRASRLCRSVQATLVDAETLEKRDRRIGTMSSVPGLPAQALRRSEGPRRSIL